MKQKPSPSPDARALRQQAEQKLRERQPSAEQTQSEIDTQALVHELQVHQIELEMQNEELHRAQLEAQQAADKYTELFDFAPVGYFVLDPQGVVCGVNLAGAALLGLDRQHVTGRPFEQYVVSDSRAEFSAFCRSVRSGEGRRSCEVRLLQHGQSHCDVLVEAALAGDDSGPAPGCRLAVTDITRRKQAETALRESERRRWVADSLGQLNTELERRLKERTATLQESEAQLRAMFDTASIGVAQADPQTGQWLRVNQKLCAITGYSADEMLQMRVPEITHPEDRPRDWEAFQQVVRGEAPAYRLEKRYVRKDGTLAWVNVNMTVIRDTTGQPARTVATIEDITARRQVETALREAHEFNQQIIASAREGIIVHDRDGKHRVWNPFMEELTGCPAAEVRDGRAPELFPFLRTYDFDRMFQRALAGETLDSPDMYFDGGRKGRKAWTVVRFAPLRDGSGAITGVIAMLNDITERKELERRLLNISEHEQQRIGQDLHDGLSQMLSGIVFLNDSLREKLVARALPEAAEAGRVGELLAQTQRDLRQVARGLQPVASAPEGLGVALTNLVKSVSERGDIACRFHCPRPVPVDDPGTATHLFRIAQEAVSNAIRHGHPKQIVVALTEKKGSLVLQVQDDGRGFRPARVREAGMGLRIMKSRSEAIRAQIEIHPAEPRGTLVRCTVPVPVSSKKESQP